MSPPAIPVSDAGRGRRRGERGGIQRRRQKRRRAVDDDDKREIAGGISDRLWAEPGQNPEFGMALLWILNSCIFVPVGL